MATLGDMKDGKVSGTFATVAIVLAIVVGQGSGGATGLAPLSSGDQNLPQSCGPAIILPFVGYPSLVAIGDWRFMNATAFNCWAYDMDVVMFAVWKTVPEGVIDAVETGGANIGAGQDANFYVPVYGIDPGTYIVTFFGVTTGNDPVSNTLQVTITLQ